MAEHDASNNLNNADLPQESLPPDDLAAIQRWLDGEQDAAAAADLNQRLKNNPALVQAMVRQAWMHQQLRQRLHVQDLQKQSLDQAFGDQDASFKQLLFALRQTEATAPGTWSPPTKSDDIQDVAPLPGEAALPSIVSHLTPARVAGLATAAVLFLGSVTGLGLWMQHGAQSPSLSANNQVDARPNTPVVVRKPVATLVALDGQLKNTAGQSFQPGDRLQPGWLHLSEGQLQLTLDDGAQVRLSAPAVWSLTDANGMALRHGQLWAFVPEAAHGFSVQTPSLFLVDLGTEFGVTIPDASDSNNDTLANGHVDHPAARVDVFGGRVAAEQMPPADQQRVQSGTQTPMSFSKPSPSHASQAMALHAGQALVQRVSTEPTNPGVFANGNGLSWQAETVQSDGYERMAPHLDLLNRNLVINGDFEADTPSTVRSIELTGFDNINIQGWQDNGPATVLDYQLAAQHNYPGSDADRLPTNPGQGFLILPMQGTLTQTIALDGLERSIRAGELRLDCSAWLGGYEDHKERIQMVVAALDAQGQTIESWSMAPVTAQDRNNQTGFVKRSLSQPVPAGTHALSITLGTEHEQTSGKVLDGYADNIALSLSLAAPGSQITSEAANAPDTPSPLDAQP